MPGRIGKSELGPLRQLGARGIAGAARSRKDLSGTRGQASAVAASSTTKPAGLTTGGLFLRAKACHPKRADNPQPSFAEATEGILRSLRARRMVGGDGIEPPTS